MTNCEVELNDEEAIALRFYMPGLISAIVCGDNSSIDTTDRGTGKEDRKRSALTKNMLKQCIGTQKYSNIYINIYYMM